MIDHLKSFFYSLTAKFTDNKVLIQSFWNELLKYYNSHKRFYHNLNHIAELLSYFNKYKELVNNTDVVLFAVFYHDVIYDVTKKDNEEKSARLALKRMSQLNVPKQEIDLCHKYILATKNHYVDQFDVDLAYFLDFDMAILGKSPEDYLAYTYQIRKEYAVFPDFMYRKGRKKVLKSFLEKERIFLTDTFYSLFEKQARENIHNELISLK